MIITSNRSPFYPNILHEWPSVIRRKLSEDNKNKIIIIDIREPWEYEDHHIPNSVLIPMNLFPVLFPKLNVKDKEIVIVCEHGNRSTYLVNTYAELLKGYRVFNMLGGVSLWMKLGYEIEKGMNSRNYYELLKLNY